MREQIFQKLDGKLRLLGSRAEYDAWVDTLDEKACYLARFTEASSSKTHEQLGYLYAGIIPDVLKGLRE